MAKSTLYVAAADAPASDISRADSTCDGTADNVQIQAAFDTLKAQGGGAVLLSPGTFNLATRLTLAGAGDVDVEQDLMLMGTGPSNTTLALGTGQASAVEINGSAKVHLHNFRIDLGSASSTAHGISSTAGNSTAGFRSFWQSSFKNLTIVGDFASHTGYGLHLDSPFRSVFENIEVNGCGSGMRMYSTNSGFNPGDCTVTRCFMDVIGTNGFGYKIESTDAVGNMNQIEFIMCEAIHSSTGGTGIYLGGTGPVNFCKFHGINLEEFDKIVHVANGNGNTFALNFCDPRQQGTGTRTAFTFGSNAANNHIENVGLLYSEISYNLYADTSTGSNLVEMVDIIQDAGTVSNGTMSSGLKRHWITAGGGGTIGSGVAVAPA